MPSIISARVATRARLFFKYPSGGQAVFTVAGHTTLKAMAYKSGMTNSNVRSADYYFHRDCGQLSPPGPEAPDTIRTVGYYLDKAGNRTSVTDTVYGNTSYTPNMRAESAAWARGATGNVPVFFGNGAGRTF